MLLGGLGLAAGAAAQTPLPAPAEGARALVHADPTEFIDLWPDGAPGAPSPPPAEMVRERSTDPTLTIASSSASRRPRMAVFRPARPNGAAVLITPGGGYSWVVVDKEGYEVARLLREQGVTVFVLFYRLPGDGWAAGPERRARRRAARHAPDPPSRRAPSASIRAASARWAFRPAAMSAPIC